MLEFDPDLLEDGRCYFPAATGEAVIVIAHAGAAHAYENCCPHLGLPLNGKSDDVVAKGGEYLVCSNHGAVFEAGSGRCVAGPCNGATLTPVPFRSTAAGCGED